MNNTHTKKLEVQVAQCYDFFVNQTIKSRGMDLKNLENSGYLEEMLSKLQQTMNTLIVTNLVNLIDRVIEDGRLRDSMPRQYNVYAIQTTKTNRIYLICHEVIGYDEVDKKYILDSAKSFIEFIDITKIY